MTKVLIVAGNVFEPTFLGACYAAQDVVGGIESVYIFDTKQSAKDAEDQKRSTKLRDLIGNDVVLAERYGQFAESMIQCNN